MLPQSGTHHRRAGPTCSPSSPAETGHVFGLGRVGLGHSNLTMYPTSFTCKTITRTLGKGDVLALRSIYY
jgi:hypothetical protein